MHDPPLLYEVNSMLPIKLDKSIRNKSNDIYSCSPFESKQDSKLRTKLKKKMKKEKKKKKKKSKKKKYRSSSSDASSNSNDEQWVEKVIEKPSLRDIKLLKNSFLKPLEREEWISSPSLFPSVSKEKSREKRWMLRKSEKEKCILNNPCQSERELNPHWRSGGTGLPEICNSSKQSIDVECMKESVQRAKERITKREISEAEMNKLGARIVKAEIMGDNEFANELRIQLEKAREMQRKSTAIKAEEERVILTRTDTRGVTRPLEPRSPNFDRHNKKKRKVQTHSKGQRVRYFANDDKYSLSEIFVHEKGKSAREHDGMFVKLASKNDDTDELFEEKITFKDTEAKQDAQDREHAIREHQRRMKSLNNCQFCIDSRNMLRHLVVAVGKDVYLSLPAHSSLTAGHCIISPLHHVSCQVQLDEDVFAEVKIFKEALSKMFEAENKIPVFFEVATHFPTHPHMQMVCIPLLLDEGNLAPMYFKKALLECETEWSNNKKIVDLKGKDIQRAIPKGLPYFHVDFGNSPGFAHIIENERLFPRNFAQEIIGGMLNLDYSLWRKPGKDSFENQIKKVMEFEKKWKHFDFTGGRKL